MINKLLLHHFYDEIQLALPDFRGFIKRVFT